MAKNSIASDLPWNRLIDELRELEGSVGPSVTLNSRHVQSDGRVDRISPSHTGGLPEILCEAADAIRSAQARAELVEREVSAVVESLRAQVRDAEAAAEARNRRAEETIRILETRARLAEERVRTLEARLDYARRALDEPGLVDASVIPIRPNPSIKGPQPMFESVRSSPAEPRIENPCNPEHQESDAGSYDDVCEAVRLSLAELA